MIADADRHRGMGPVPCAPGFRLILLIWILMVGGWCKDRDDVRTLATRAHALRAKGEYREAVHLWLEVRQREPRNPMHEYNLSCSYFRLEDLDQGFDALRAAFTKGYKHFVWLETDPDLEKARTTERFQEIVGAARARFAASLETEDWIPEGAPPEQGWPLIIVQHGAGGDPKRWRDWLSSIRPECLILSLKNPHSYVRDHHSAEVVLENAVLLLIERAKAKWKVDAANVVLVGYSLGAIRSYYGAIRHPEIIRGAVCIEGRYEKPATEILEKAAETRLSLCILHGDQGGNVLDWVQEEAADLQKAGLRTKVIVYPQQQFHAFSKQNLDSISEAFQWIEAADRRP